MDTSKGPWTALELDRIGWMEVRSADHRTVAQVMPQMPDETRANAALIAAAPRLRLALQALFTACNDESPTRFRVMCHALAEADLALHAAGVA